LHDLYGRSGFRFTKDDHAQGHDPENERRIMREVTSGSDPAAGQGKVPVTDERMDAIRNLKTMAGSPDADRLVRSASRHLAHGLFVFGRPALVNP
jgi:hypothetical protein